MAASSSSASTGAAGNIALDDAARHSADLESTAEAVMHAKALLVDLDRRLNQTREGIRALRSIQETQHAALRRREAAAAIVHDNDALARRRIAALVGMPGVAEAVAASDAATEALLGGSSGSGSGSSSPAPAPTTFVTSQPMWLLCSGGAFVRTDQARAYDKLLKTSHETRHELKTRVADLARLEGVDSALARANAGFDLAGKTPTRDS